MGSTTYLISTADESDAHALAPLLRKQDVAELMASAGELPLPSLLEAVRCSDWCKRVEIDGGEVSALFGVTPLPPERVDSDYTVGLPWLLSSDEFFRHPKILVREAPKWVAKMQESYEVLLNFIDCRNTKPMYWLESLGFEFTRLYTKFGHERVPFLQFERTA